MTLDGLGTEVRKAVVIGCALLALLAAAAVAAPSARADSFTWVGPQSLIATGGTNTVPTVSCPSTSQCTTVDGKGEQISFTPSTGAILTRTAVDVIGTVASVSCPGTDQCTAVDNGGNEITFSPSSGAVNGAGRDNIDLGHHLTGVSCASDTSCVAVDDHGQEVAFDPSTGRVLGGGPRSIDGTTPLTGVSCPGGGSCTAVDNSGHEVTFSVGSGGAVTVVSSAGIDGATPLNSVSCPDGTVCAAVDGNGYEVSFTPATGALVGTATQIDTNSGIGVPLNSVSCPSTGSCVAVDSQGNEVTFAPTLTPAASVHSIDSNTYLTAVSCPAGTASCAALDKPSDSRGREVQFTTAGVATNPQTIVAPVLDGLSCPARTQCTAIASDSREATFDPTTGALNGAGVASVDPSGNPLTGVSCISTTECTAVDNGGDEVTFDPTTGNVIANGFISVDTNAVRSVACLVASGTPQCTVVDTAGNEVTFNPQTSQINSFGLSQVDNSGGALESVACPSSTQCTAVDSRGNEVTFNPANGAYYGTVQFVTVDPGQVLNSVSCPSTSQCTAVDKTGGVVTFTGLPATPAVPPRQEIERGSISLNSVDCPATNQCTAVDSLGQEATFDPGSASLDASLLRPASGSPQANALEQAGSLGAVDCQSTVICAAVDAEGNNFSGVVPPSDTTLPTISGQAQQNDLLSETNGSWTNFPTRYSYQWEACSSPTDQTTCTPATGSPSTASTYTPVVADIGRYIRVQEIAYNAGGPGTAVLSAATAKVTPAPATNSAAPTISSASSLYQQGQQLAEHQGTWNEPSSAPLTYTYQWLDCDAAGAHCAEIAGGSGQTYTPAVTDIGHTLRVQETADNGGTPVPVPVASVATPVIEPAPPAILQAPPIVGVAQEGRLLTDQHGTWSNTQVPTTYTYQWQECDGAGAHCAPIAGATGQTYTPAVTDIGHTLRVQETAANGGQPTPGPASSAPTAVVVPKAPAAISPPTIAGPIAQGRTLSEGHGVWSTGPDAPTGYSYQWEDCSPSGANCAPIAGATSSTYTPVAGDVGHAIVVLETAGNAGGGTPAASAPTAPAAPAPAPAIDAYTQPVTAIQGGASTAHARLATGGVSVNWQFVYGTTTRYTGHTPLQSIPAGSTGDISITRQLTNLRPNTKYHYRIVETVAATPYIPAVTAYGLDLTFTTGPAGKVALSSTRLGVSPRGGLSLPLFCQSTIDCVGHFSVTAAGRRGGAVCKSGSAHARALTRHAVSVTLTRSCLGLLQGAPGQTLPATFTMHPRLGQPVLTEKVTLVLQKTRARRHRA